MSAQVTVKLSQKALHFTVEALDTLAAQYQKRREKKGVSEDEAADLGNDLGLIRAIRDDLAAKLSK